jgi:hypothetical protein
MAWPFACINGRWNRNDLRCSVGGRLYPLPMILAETDVELVALPRVSDVIPCEMADPVAYAADGTSVETFKECADEAEWRLVLRWHSVPGSRDEHLLCSRHLSVWDAFRLVENPPWDVVHRARL